MNAAIYDPPQVRRETAHVARRTAALACRVALLGRAASEGAAPRGDNHRYVAAYRQLLAGEITP